MKCIATQIQQLTKKTTSGVAVGIPSNGTATQKDMSTISSPSIKRDICSILYIYTVYVMTDYIMKFLV